MVRQEFKPVNDKIIVNIEFFSPPFKQPAIQAFVALSCPANKGFRIAPTKQYKNKYIRGLCLLIFEVLISIEQQVWSN